MQCQLDVLERLRTAKDIRDALHTLPNGLFETYQRILEEINAAGEGETRIARAALTWVLGSVRQVTLKELARVITAVPERYTFDPDLEVSEPEEILDVCKGLLHMNAEEKVALSHFTVKVCGSKRNAMS